MHRLSGFTTPPTIETERLILRAHAPDDLTDCTALWQDPGVLRFVRRKPYTREEVWTRILRYGGHWQWLGFGFWAVFERAGGGLVGEVGIQNFEREIETEFQGVPELGYAMASFAHGRGYASEAAHAALAWLDQHIDIPYTNCMTSPDNIRSQRVALKCGYRYLRPSLHDGGPVAIFRRQRHATPLPGF